MTTATTEQQTVTCPEWCTANHSGEDVDWAPPIHYRRVGNLGVEVWSDDGADGSLNAPQFTLGDPVDVGDLSLEQVRQLGADLLAAVDIAGGAA